MGEHLQPEYEAMLEHTFDDDSREIDEADEEISAKDILSSLAVEDDEDSDSDDD